MSAYWLGVIQYLNQCKLPNLLFLKGKAPTTEGILSLKLVLNSASWCIYVYLLAFTSSPDETKSTCTVERLFAFTPNHLLVRHNYFLHNLQLFADFDFSVLQRVKVANSGHDSLLGPRLVQKTEFCAQTRGLPAAAWRGATKKFLSNTVTNANWKCANSWLCKSFFSLQM